MKVVTFSGVESQKQAQLSLCTIDTFTEDNYSIKIIKQKLLVSVDCVCEYKQCVLF